MNRRCLLLLFALLPGGLFVRAGEPFVFRRPAMGTVWTIKLYGEDEGKAGAAAEAAFARIEELNGILSDYLPGSPLSRLSATAGTGKAVTVKGDLMTVLAQSQQAAAESGGAFDITIGPCVQLWRAAKKTRQLPTVEALAAARTASGWKHMELDSAAGTVVLKQPGMKLDAGGIAKGYAQDEAMKVLRRMEFTCALIDCGGSPLVSGRPPGRDGWTVQVAKTGEEDPEVLVRVENACVDTSGDLHQFVEIDGRRYSHIIDPATGLGLTDSTQSTVVTASATLADWLATALCIMGPDKGIDFLSRTHPEALARVVRRTAEGRLVARESPGFAALVVKPRPEAADGGR